MHIYVIETLVKDELTTSHIFLTEVAAYRKFIDLLGEYYDSGTVKKMWLIEREINDETGIFHDRIIDMMLKMDSKGLDQENEEDIE